MKTQLVKGCDDCGKCFRWEFEDGSKSHSFQHVSYGALFFTLGVMSAKADPHDLGRAIELLCDRELPLGSLDQHDLQTACLYMEVKRRERGEPAEIDDLLREEGL